MRSILNVSVLSICVSFALIVSCASMQQQDDETAFVDNFPRTGIAPEKNPFIHASGRDLVDAKGKKIILRGIAFGNDVWSNPADSPKTHHTGKDFEHCKSLGINSIRFYLNYRIFEDDAAPYTYKESGFAVLDKNIEWAKANGIYLILNIHVPQGGFQSNAEGGDLWNYRENQKRFTALWKEIARRYKNESTILGFDILNEPVVTRDLSQWERLAKETVAAIREHDPQHIIIVERLNAVIISPDNTDWNENRNGDMNFFTINDTNVMYEFHFYKPMQFTHQGASWIWPLKNISTVYPGQFTDWDGSEKTGNRELLEQELAPYIAFGMSHNVPLYLGEFGVIRKGFEGNRNGVGWVRDMIDIAAAHNINISYHAYHETAFGLFSNDVSNLPDNPNKPLEELFREKFKEKGK
ncbi:MAG TPA: glycoside hydrolase family 5 protein [Spirochaetota bacterium]